MLARGSKLSSIVVLVGAVAVLGACGGGGEDDEKTKVEDTIKEGLTSSDSSKCSELYTEDFLKQVELEDDESDALESCKEDAGENNPDSVEFDEVSVDGDTAEATFTTEGGELPGTFTTELTKEGDDWKLDEITSFEVGDREDFDAALKKRLESPPNPFTAAQADCAVKALSDGDLEQAVEDGDTETIEAAFTPCVRGGGGDASGGDGDNGGGGSGGGGTGAQERSRFARALLKEVTSGDNALSRPIAECVVKKLKSEATDGEVDALLAGEANDSLLEKARNAGRTCAGG